MSDKLTIWCNAWLPADAWASLEEGVKNHRLFKSDEQASNLGTTGPSDLLLQADIAFGQPDPDQVIAAQRLRWVQLTSAGYTRYDRDDLRQALWARGAGLTNSSSVYDEPCAQHLLAFMLAQARELPRSLIAQHEGRGWVNEELRNTTRLLRDVSALLVGYGAIARRLVQLLKPFDLHLTALRRHVKGDEAIRTHPIEDLDDLLPTADHVVNILPANPSTANAFGAAQFAAMKPGACFYNIGRGTTVNQSALIEALQSGHLAVAYLDVTEPEPLPSDHPLWTTPNCYVTPHIGGGYAGEPLALVEHFLENLRCFERGDGLADRVI